MRDVTRKDKSCHRYKKEYIACVRKNNLAFMYDVSPSPPCFFSEFAYVFRLSVSTRKVASEHSFCVLIYMNSYIFRIHFILCIYLFNTYLMFDLISLTISLANTFRIGKYAGTNTRRYTHSHTHTKIVGKVGKRKGKKTGGG